MGNFLDAIHNKTKATDAQYAKPKAPVADKKDAPKGEASKPDATTNTPAKKAEVKYEALSAKEAKDRGYNGNANTDHTKIFAAVKRDDQGHYISGTIFSTKEGVDLNKAVSVNWGVTKAFGNDAKPTDDQKKALDAANQRIANNKGFSITIADDEDPKKARIVSIEETGEGENKLSVSTVEEGESTFIGAFKEENKVAQRIAVPKAIPIGNSTVTGTPDPQTRLTRFKTSDLRAAKADANPALAPEVLNQQANAKIAELDKQRKAIEAQSDISDDQKAAALQQIDAAVAKVARSVTADNMETTRQQLASTQPLFAGAALANNTGAKNRTASNDKLNGPVRFGVNVLKTGLTYGAAVLAFPFGGPVASIGAGMAAGYITDILDQALTNKDGKINGSQLFLSTALGGIPGVFKGVGALAQATRIAGKAPWFFNAIDSVTPHFSKVGNAWSRFTGGMTSKIGSPALKSFVQEGLQVAPLTGGISATGQAISNISSGNQNLTYHLPEAFGSGALSGLLTAKASNAFANRVSTLAPEASSQIASAPSSLPRATSNSVSTSGSGSPSTPTSGLRSGLGSEPRPWMDAWITSEQRIDTIANRLRAIDLLPPNQQSVANNQLRRELTAIGENHQDLINVARQKIAGTTPVESNSIPTSQPPANPVVVTPRTTARNTLATQHSEFKGVGDDIAQAQQAYQQAVIRVNIPGDPTAIPQIKALNKIVSTAYPEVDLVPTSANWGGRLRTAGMTAGLFALPAVPALFASAGQSEPTQSPVENADPDTNNPFDSLVNAQ